jgi:tetratricopeptide (TPR) repeat protein
MEQNDFESAREMNRAGGECLQKDDHEGALRNFSKALELLPENQSESRARLYNNIGHAQVRLKKYDEALSSFRNAGQIFEKMGDTLGLGEQFANIGSVHRDLEAWGASLENYFKALGIFEEAQHKGGMADQFSNIAYAYTGQGDLERAYPFFQKAKGLYDEMGEGTKSRLCDQNMQAIKPHLRT